MEPRRDIILVVDDSPDTLGFLTQAVESTGATVLVALDGESALTLTEQGHAGSDPDGCRDAGYRRLRSLPPLKAIDHLAHVPVIFMTGLSETEHIVRGLEVGGVDYLTKPIVVDELLARVRVHLRNARRFGCGAFGPGCDRSFPALGDAGRNLALVDAASGAPAATDLAGGAGERLPAAAGDRGLDGPGAEGGPESPTHIWSTDGRKVELAYLGEVRAGELPAPRDASGAAPGCRSAAPAFRPHRREAEVLLWIARGKSNKDISTVLGISPRTVNKHLEQIFEKLAVENRASAAALTIQALHKIEAGLLS